MPIELKKCTLASSFDSRIFFAGNQDYPSTLFHSELEDPRYVRDTAYYEEGFADKSIRNSAIWVFKEPSQNNTTVFYHKPTIDYTYGKIYPKEVSKISTGCFWKLWRYSFLLNFGGSNKWRLR